MTASKEEIKCASATTTLYSFGTKKDIYKNARSDRQIIEDEQCIPTCIGQSLHSFENFFWDNPAKADYQNEKDEKNGKQLDNQMEAN